MKRVGDDYEKQACQFLVHQGLAILATNYTVHRVGEIDIIAYDEVQRTHGGVRKTLVFVEVKMRHHHAHHRGRQFGQAIDSVTPAKQKKLIKTAEYFLVQGGRYLQGLDLQALECRFDVIAFDVCTHDAMDNVIDNPHNFGQNQVKIDWIKNAFLVE